MASFIRIGYSCYPRSYTPGLLDSKASPNKFTCAREIRLLYNFRLTYVEHELSNLRVCTARYVFLIHITWVL